MTESIHLKPCPVCASSLSITHDRIDDTITLRPEDVPPLARDCMGIVAAYKRLKGLGADWQRQHGSRGLIYASELLLAVGVRGGQMERALGILEWLGGQPGKTWDLGTAPTHVMAYLEAVKAKEQASRGRCAVCGESFAGQGNRCPSHVWVKDEEI